MNKGVVFDIMKFSTRDGPGIRTTVFLKGCPLSCQWCHNPESQKIKPELMFRPNLCIGCRTCVEVCPEGAVSFVNNHILYDRSKCKLCGACVQACYADAREIVGHEMTVSEVMVEIEKDIPFYDESGGGVTFSGGEAIVQHDFLLGLLEACKEKGIHTALDTSGYAPWMVFDSIREYVDLFLYDMKQFDEDAHRRYTGVSNKMIKANLEELSRLGHNIILRVPLIPGVNDDDETLRRFGEYAASLPNLVRMELLPYHLAGVEKYRRLSKPYQLENTQPPSDTRMEEIALFLRGYALPIQVGG
jgi:pyruvate formate lyase activating enzyme